MRYSLVNEPKYKATRKLFVATVLALGILLIGLGTAFARQAVATQEGDKKERIAQSIVTSKVLITMTDKKIQKVESDRYTLFVSPSTDEPFLTYTVLNGMGAGTMVTLEVFADSNIVATWGPITKIRGRYEGYMDKEALEDLVERVVRVGMLEPGGVVNPADLPRYLESGAFELKLKGDSLYLKALPTATQYAPYESTLKTPSVGCNSANSAAQAKALCELKALHDLLHTTSVKLAE